MAKKTKPSKTKSGPPSLHNVHHQRYQNSEGQGDTQRNIAVEPCSTLKLGVAPTGKRGVPLNSGSLGILHVPESAFARVVEVLRRARWYVARGWVQNCSWIDAEGKTFSGQMGKTIAWSLYGAIAEAGQGTIEGEYARRALRQVIGEVNIPAWNDYPLRRRDDVLWALDRAMELLGGRKGLKGGPRVTFSASQRNGEEEAS